MDRQHFVDLSAYLNGTLDRSGVRRIESMLQEDDSLSDELLRLAFEESIMRDWARARRRSTALDETVASLESSGELAKPSRRSNSLKALALVGCVVLLLLAVQLWRTPSASVPAGTLANVQGDVVLLRSDGTNETAANGRDVEPGREMRLRGPRSTATLVYHDGSQLMLMGDGRLRLSGPSGKLVELARGQIGATVAKQPVRRPLRILTPTASVEVVGTRFSMEATPTETEVSVVEGRVKLTRIADGKTIDLPSGRRARAGNERGEFGSEPMTASTTAFDVNFEDGLPSGWQTGTAVSVGQPPRHGVRAQAVREPDGVVYGITTAKAWREGLFSLKGNDHLHFTYRLDKPDWFQIFLSTRALAGDKPPVATYRFKDERLWWPLQPGKWRTASIPLSRFTRVSDWSERPFSTDELPFELLFSSKDNNLSLVIDRIWVSTEGAGEFVVE